MSMSEKIKNSERMENSTHLFLDWAGSTVTPVKKAGDHVSCRPTQALEIRLHPSSLYESWGKKTKSSPKTKSAHQIDAKTEKKIKQGKVQPQGRLDLHGYRYEAARTALRRFILDAVEKEKRCLLVVTGKGDPALPNDETITDTQTPRGVIRRAFPEWLKEPPLDHIVLKAYPATPAQGGTGAWYVYLRRAR